MIEEINLQNFKNFDENQAILLKPLTLIYGPNSSGKSSILQSLLLLKQTIENSNKSNIALLPIGNYVDIGNFKEFINKHDTSKIFHMKFFANLPKDIKLFKNPAFRQLKTNKFGLEIEFGAEAETFIKQINVFAGKEIICSLANSKNPYLKSRQMRLFHHLDAAQQKFQISSFNWDASFWKDYWLIFQQDMALNLEKMIKSGFLNEYNIKNQVLEEELKESESEFSNELNQISELKEKIDEVESNQQDLEWKKDDLAEKKDELESHTQELQNTKNKLEDKIQEFKKEVENRTPALELSYFNIDVHQLENRILELKESLKDVGDSIDDLGSDIYNIGYDIDDLETDTSSSVGMDIQSIGDDIEDLGKSIKNFDEPCELDNYISKFDEKIDELEEKISDLDDLTSELEDSISEIEEQLKPLDSLRQKINELKEEFIYYMNLKKIVENNDYQFLQTTYKELYENIFFDLRNFLPTLSKYSLSNSVNKDFERYNRINLIEVIQYLSNNINEYLKRIDYIGPRREKPERLYTFDGNIHEYVGQSGKMVPNILFKNNALIADLNELFKSFDLDYRLEIAKLNKNEKDIIDSFSLRLIDTNTGTALSLLDVGFGVCQLLPIAVQCLIAKDKILLIEEPEIHLHPKLQAEVGEFIAKSIKKGKNNRFIIETHSENIILRIQKLIRKGEINSDDVSVIYVEKNSKNSVCHNLLIDKQGEFLNDWPDGFFEESFNELFG